MRFNSLPRSKKIFSFVLIAILLTGGACVALSRYKTHERSLAGLNVQFDKATRQREDIDRAQTAFKSALDVFMSEGAALIADFSDDPEDKLSGSNWFIKIPLIKQHISDLTSDDQATKLLLANNDMVKISDTLYQAFQKDDIEMKDNLNGFNEILTSFEANPFVYGLALMSTDVTNDSATAFGTKIGLSMLARKNDLERIMEDINETQVALHTDEDQKKNAYETCLRQSPFSSVIHPECPVA